MPRGVYEHYQAEEYLQFIFEAGGMPSELAHDVIWKYLSWAGAEALLMEIAELQKSDNFTGNSATIFDEYIAFREGELQGELGQIFQDLNSIGVYNVYNRFYNNYYDMTPDEQEDWILNNES